MESTVIALVVVFFLALYLLLFFSRSQPTSTTDWEKIEGRLIWLDDGPHTKPFFNNSFLVYGKPDMIYQQRSGLLAVEYKNRNGGVYASDIIQAKCASLAARGSGKRITHILIRTNTAERQITLPASDKDLHQSIQQNISLARSAKAGKRVPPTNNKNKCSSCGYRDVCEYK